MTPPLATAERLDWLNARRLCLGSSECWQIFIPWLAAQLGPSDEPHVIDLGNGPTHVAMPLVDSGPHKVWMAKVEPVQDDAPGPDDPRTIGNLHESGVVEWATLKLGAQGHITPSHQRHPDHPWLGATGDALALVNGTHEGIEAKFVQHVEDERKDIWYQDAAPLFVQLQALVCCIVYDVERWHIAAYVPHRGHVLYPPVDLTSEVTQRYAERLLQVCGDWWRVHVEGNTPPAVDGSASCMAAIKRVHPADRGPVRRADVDDVRLITDWRDAERARIAAETAAKQAKHRLCNAIADDSGIYARGLGKVTWKADKSGNRRLRFTKERG